MHIKINNTNKFIGGLYTAVVVSQEEQTIVKGRKSQSKQVLAVVFEIKDKSGK